MRAECRAECIRIQFTGRNGRKRGKTLSCCVFLAHARRICGIPLFYSSLFCPSILFIFPRSLPPLLFPEDLFQCQKLHPRNRSCRLMCTHIHSKRGYFSPIRCNSRSGTSSRDKKKESLLTRASKNRFSSSFLRRRMYLGAENVRVGYRS